MITEFLFLGIPYSLVNMRLGTAKNYGWASGGSSILSGQLCQELRLGQRGIQHSLRLVVSRTTAGPAGDPAFSQVSCMIVSRTTAGPAGDPAFSQVSNFNSDPRVNTDHVYCSPFLLLIFLLFEMKACKFVSLQNKELQYFINKEEIKRGNAKLLELIVCVLYSISENRRN